MKVIVPGGTGALGRILVPALRARGHHVVVLSRTPNPDDPHTVTWDPLRQGPWTTVMNGADAVINLAGASIACRHTLANVSRIVESRVQASRALAVAMGRAINGPTTWLQMSSACTYLQAGDVPCTETSPTQRPLHATEASAHIASWESACMQSPTPGVRKVLLRTGRVLHGQRGGYFARSRQLARVGLGGAMGSGDHWVSWIHQHDFVRAVVHALTTPSVEGPLNLTAPHPITQRRAMAQLRAIMGVSVGLPLPTWLLAPAAWMAGVEPRLLLQSRRVTPAKLALTGFTFDYPHWHGAVGSLLGRGVYAMPYTLTAYTEPPTII